MIENAMFLALGFFVATLIALACVPAIWDRAVRLSRRRLEMLVPLSMTEILAERDGIRAEAAVAQRRLEQALERSAHSAARLAADLGRRTVSLVAAEKDREALRSERANLVIEVAALSRQVLDVEGQRGALEKALYDADCRIERELMERRERARAYDQLLDLAEERRGSIASLETQNSGLHARIEDRDSDIQRLNVALADLRSVNSALTRERDTARNEALLATTQRTMVQAQLKNEIDRAADRNTRLLAKSEALAAAERRIMEQEADIKASARALAELKQRLDALQARLIETLPENSSETSVSDDELAQLRRGIIEVADDALRLMTPNPNPNPNPTVPPTAETQSEKLPTAGALL
jgi:chromosome segregation ATPase